MHRCSDFLALVVSVFVLCALVQPAPALVYTGSLDHTTAPQVDPGWDNVGLMSIGSGTYLGDGWVLAPYHVYQHDHPEDRGTSRIVLDQAYYEIPGTARRIEYSSSVNSDLIMFRIDGRPDLALIEISNTAPLSQEVTVIATGRGGVGDQVDFGGGYTGFRTESTRVKRWGRNVTAGYTTTQSSPWGRANVFTTYFDFPGLVDDECQLVSGDSGGSAFVERAPGGSWQLAGIALAVSMPGGYTGPNVTQNAVYDNSSLYANLAEYRADIDAIRLIPLPGDADWDGDVDDLDIGILQATFGQIGPDLQADFNDDNIVNLEDFAILRTNLGMVSGNGIPGAEDLPVQLVPEPATIILLAGAVGLLGRSRKRIPSRRRR
ncbi:MAG: trypsin-like serine protease [Phycisphaerae bacterium]|jgi:hypothetical protein|nr:trypsin-like serine protease [Phycisphaerae bacterium]